MPIALLVLKILTPFLQALDKAADDPAVRALIASIARKCWDSVTVDPNFKAKLDVDVKTLATPDLTVKEIQDDLQDIVNSHPKS